MYDTATFVRTRAPGEIHISKPIEAAKRLRYASMRLEDGEVHEFYKDKGELLVRPTPSGTRQIKARFIETSRNILTLTLQRWTDDDPFGECKFALAGKEVAQLLDFVRDVQRVHLTKGRLVVEPGALEHPRFTDDELLGAMHDKRDLIREFLATDTQLGDFKALGFRRKSLEEFKRLLDDADYFEAKHQATPNKSAERVWQEFFEADNGWIFGYGISYVFMTGIDPDRLQQAVAGHTAAWKGHAPDAVMKTHGAVSALSLVELKTHQTDLVKNTPVRPGTFSASRELSDAVSQCQMATLAAERQLQAGFQPADGAGNPLSEPIYTYRPRSTLVIGRLSEFQTEHGINTEKYSSFEMYRRNLVMPEVITFDELYERARFIVEQS